MSSLRHCASLQLGNEWLTVRAGGLNRYAAGLASGLDASGAQQEWLVMGRREELENTPGYVTGVAAANHGLWNRWAGMRRAFAHAIADPPDVVASHFALYAYPVRRRLRKMPHVVHFHGPWADESTIEGANRFATAAKKHIENSVYRTGDRFITLSQAFANLLAQRYRVDEDRIRVVPGGVDVEHFDSDLSRHEAREQLGWPTDRPVVLCVRRLARRMGIDRLIDATVNLTKDHPDALVLIAGKGPLEGELRSRIQSAGLQRHVRLLGFVPDAELPIAYRAADLSIVPTQSLEGFGLIVLESLASGTPAIVTPVGGLPEVVQDFAPQLVLANASADAIADGLAAALNGTLALPGAKQCQDYVQDHFTWPKIASRVLEVYEEARTCG